MLQAADIVIRLNPADDVVIARVEIPEGTMLLREGVRTAVRVPPGHKIAVKDVRTGAPVRRYNQIIGFATRDIAAGDHVHVHNIAMGTFERDYAFCADLKPTDYLSPAATFEGIVRPDGRVATRNYIGIITSVNCSASVARFMAEAVNRSGILADYPHVDGVVSFVHGTGCGLAAKGEGITAAAGAVVAAWLVAAVLDRAELPAGTVPLAIVPRIAGLVPRRCLRRRD